MQVGNRVRGFKTLSGRPPLAPAGQRAVYACPTFSLRQCASNISLEYVFKARAALQLRARYGPRVHLLVKPPQIMRLIQLLAVISVPPVRSAASLSILDFGGKPEPGFNNQGAIAKAMRACDASNGCTLLFPGQTARGASSAVALVPSCPTPDCLGATTYLTSAINLTLGEHLRQLCYRTLRVRREPRQVRRACLFRRKWIAPYHFAEPTYRSLWVGGCVLQWIQPVARADECHGDSDHQEPLDQRRAADGRHGTGYDFYACGVTCTHLSAATAAAAAAAAASHSVHSTRIDMYIYMKMTQANSVTSR